MHTARNKGRFAFGAAAVGVALALSGCASGDPLATDDETAADETIVIGSQAYFSNEIIAEIYAQALEDAGFDVEREFNIGQRDAYIPSIENGDIDLFPEYTGNLLQFYDEDTEATETGEVYAQLQDVLPEGLVVLDQSPATDQDSYNVTAEFAEEHELESLADLSEVDVELILGGAPELEERPYGPDGLSETYDVEVSFVPTGDTTVDDLLAGTVNIANVYSADPRIQTEDLVTLDDPEGLFLASNVVPLANAEIADEIAEVINAVSAALTPEGLVALNVESTVDQRSAEDIAADWLAENGLVG
ncbi:ABC transporter substrate-binding protein [Salinibacterium sp. SYSU T00001]|uniref:ABC transporter substrate-binding protein n=1 Tax=Homoserinimonas sedimenticola TaxID=2986805 RepID=UPI002236739B|nr:ABC transporter substrate-binding protein [Salinibacterium sedimenticola]MCW4385999.1 ABC transporter substrate-binding protein [Salinibacterium sedimenticola]